MFFVNNIQLNFKNKSTSTQALTTTPFSNDLLDNNFPDFSGIYNLSWVPSTNFVDFTFKVNVPSGSSTNFWAAFAFSTDTSMVNSFKRISN